MDFESGEEWIGHARFKTRKWRPWRFRCVDGFRSSDYM